MSEKAILFDSSRCTGCKGCQVACKVWNELPTELEPNSYEFTGSYQNPADLNSNTRLVMTFNEFTTDSQKGVGWAISRRACQHCTNAGCAIVCPAGAISHDPDTGFVVTDETKCVGCQRCHAACPYDVPRYDDKDLRTTLNKCTACADRVANGMAPACVSTCQPNALQFGDRDEMIKRAQESVERLKARGYEDACVYGVDEMDGLHVIQVLKYGIEPAYQVENPSLPAATTLTEIMKPLAAVGMGATVLGLGAMFGLAAGYKRDTLVYNEETKDTISKETGQVVKQGDPQDDRTIKEALTENLPIGKKGKGEDHE